MNGGDEMETFGQVMRNARLEQGFYSGSGLARHLGKSPSYITYLERDQRKPNRAMVVAICVALELNYDVMLELAGLMTPERKALLKIGDMLKSDTSEHATIIEIANECYRVLAYWGDNL